MEAIRSALRYMKPPTDGLIYKHNEAYWLVLFIYKTLFCYFVHT